MWLFCFYWKKSEVVAVFLTSYKLYGIVIVAHNFLCSCYCFPFPVWGSNLIRFHLQNPHWGQLHVLWLLQPPAEDLLQEAQSSVSRAHQREKSNSFHDLHHTQSLHCNGYAKSLLVVEKSSWFLPCFWRVALPCDWLFQFCKKKIWWRGRVGDGRVYSYLYKLMVEGLTARLVLCV